MELEPTISVSVHAVVIAAIYLTVGRKLTDVTKFLACHNIYLMLNAAASIIMAALMLTSNYSNIIKHAAVILLPGYLVLLFNSIMWMFLSTKNVTDVKFTLVQHVLHMVVGIVLTSTYQIETQKLLPYILLWLGSLVCTSFANAYLVTANHDNVVVITIAAVFFQTIWRLSVYFVVLVLHRSDKPAIFIVMCSIVVCDVYEIAYYLIKMVNTFTIRKSQPLYEIN
jgi:hypothetical protein